MTAHSKTVDVMVRKADGQTVIYEIKRGSSTQSDLNRRAAKQAEATEAAAAAASTR